VVAIKAKFNEYVEDVKEENKLDDDDIKLVTDKKHRYLLKVKADVELSEDYDKIASTQKEVKYSSDRLLRLIEELEVAENTLKNALLPFIRLMFKKFHDNKDMFSKAIMILAELDCLCSLGHLSADESLGPMVRPVISDAKGKPFINLESMRHPAV
jgi:DNA mismatch repair protein MSH6